jgi:hypothetical protein
LDPLLQLNWRITKKNNRFEKKVKGQNGIFALTKHAIGRYRRWGKQDEDDGGYFKSKMFLLRGGFPNPGGLV